MPNPNENGRNVVIPDENRPSWRPQDEGYRSRDDDRTRSRREDRDDDRHGMRDRSRWSGRSDDDRDEGYRHRGYGDDRPAMHTDDRHTGRDDRYWPDRGGYRDDRTGYGTPRGAIGYEGPSGGLDRGYRGGQGYEARGSDEEGRRGAIRGRQNYGTTYGRGWQASQERELGQHRGKGPKGYIRSDERIKEHVCEALADDDYIDATHIEVAVKNGDVILTGTVEDRETKHGAEDLVERISGVKDVQNQLRVQPHRGNPTGHGAVGT